MNSLNVKSFLLEFLSCPLSFAVFFLFSSRDLRRIIMNNYSAFLRSNNGKSSMNNENDENSSIKNLFFKHLSKNGPMPSNGKGTIRGILGELGNSTLTNKNVAPIISKTKIVQQTVATLIETKSTSNLSAFVASAPSTTNIPQVINQIEEIVLKDEHFPVEFDCDSGDSHNIITASEYVVDICKYWRNLEEQTPIRANFLSNRAEGTCSPQNRAVLIDWLYQVHDRFKLLSDTFHMTIQIIDRFLQLVDVSKHNLQLIGSTALLIACKYEEMTIPGMNDFVYVSDNAFSKDEMKEMERSIISTLSYDLGRPLSINYLRRYSKIVQATDIEHTLGKYLLDLTFIDHSMAHWSPSYTGACASFLSRYLFAFKRLASSTSVESLIEDLWPRDFMNFHTGYTYEQLRSGIEQLAQLLMGQETSKLRSVVKKFSQSNLFSIAQNSCCKSAFVQMALARLVQ